MAETSFQPRGDISSLLAGAAQTNADFDFGKINRSYWEGLDQNYKQRTRDVFKDGIPTNDDGTPNYSEAAKKLYQLGDVNSGNTLSNLDIQRQQMKFGQQQSGAIQNFEGGGQPTPTPQPTVAPSTSRNGATPVAPPIGQNARPASPPQANASPKGDQSGSIVGMISAMGVPDELAGPIIQQVSAATRLDPNAAVDPNLAPRVQQIAAAAAQRMRQGNQQQGAPQQPAAQPAPQQPVAAPQQAVPQPQAVQPQQPAPVTNSVTTTTGPQTPSRNDQAIAYYSGIMSDPRSPKGNVELAKSRLEAVQKNSEFTPLQKEYSQAVLQGFKGTMQDFAADMETRKTAATEEAKMGSKKYESLVESGTKAQMEIPQLELLQQQMNDPNFFSGAGEKYNLLYKRLKSAVGIDPDAAVPQEFLRKATAANVLSGLGALKGLGQIRVAEINMAREASAAPENSIPANKLLVEISKRTHERNAQIAEMAQDYKEKNGSLDAGFDKKVTAYYKKTPLFNDGEIKDWHKVIGEAPKQGAPGGPQKFASPGDVHAAIAAGSLKKGDTFTDSNGVMRTVP